MVEWAEEKALRLALEGTVKPISVLFTQEAFSGLSKDRKTIRLLSIIGQLFAKRFSASKIRKFCNKSNLVLLVIATDGNKRGHTFPAGSRVGVQIKIGVYSHKTVQADKSLVELNTNFIDGVFDDI